MKYQTIIEDFIFNNSSAKEKEQFQSDLLTNPDLKKEYDTYLEILETIQSAEISVSEKVNELQDFKFDREIELTVAEYLSDQVLSESERKLSGVIRGILNAGVHKKTNLYIEWFKVAAFYILLITLTASVSVFERVTNPVTINITDFESALYFPLVVRGGMDSDSSYYKAINYYYDGFPDSTLLVLTSDNESDRLLLKDPLLESSCLMELNKPSEALVLLRNVSSSSLYYSSALWHMAICNLMLDEREKAKDLLKKLKSIDPGYKVNTNKLLRKIYLRNNVNISFNVSSYFGSIVREK